MLAEIDPKISERFGSDTVALSGPTAAFGVRRENWKPFRLADGSECLVPGDFEPVIKLDGSLIVSRKGWDLAKMPAGGYYFDSLTKALGAFHPDLSTYEPRSFPDDHFEFLGHEAARSHAETDKALVIGFGPPYELFYGMGQGDFEEWMVTFASEPEYVDEIYGRMIDRWIENLEKLWQAVGDKLHVLQFCDDLGTQNAPFLSTEMFRDRVMPAYRRGIDWIHTHTPWKVLMHSDGAIFPLIPSLLEMGIDALNPHPDHRCGDGPRKNQRDLRWEGRSLGCLGRQPEQPHFRHPRNGGRGSAAPSRHPSPAGGWDGFRERSQRPGHRPAGKYRRPLRRGTEIPITPPARRRGPAEGWQVAASAVSFLFIL